MEIPFFFFWAHALVALELLGPARILAESAAPGPRDGRTGAQAAVCRSQTRPSSQRCHPRCLLAQQKRAPRGPQLRPVLDENFADRGPCQRIGGGPKDKISVSIGSLGHQRCRRRTSSTISARIQAAQIARAHQGRVEPGSQLQRQQTPLR